MATGTPTKTPADTQTDTPPKALSPKIHQLTPAVVNKIAAGEVIERPASVVKELLENAVDAGAGRIELTVAGGGAELIRVADDGCGIAADQLELALASHATSKITTDDDLFQVATLGFRGEALASIASVSRLLLSSRPASADAGAQVEMAGGSSGAIEPCGRPIGTTVEVRDLFFNTPVRRKFLRTAPTETGHITEAFTRIALAFPQKHFILRRAGRVLHDLPPVASWLERIGALFGAELREGLIEVRSEDGPVMLDGYVAHPDLSRGAKGMQYLLLNGRHIRDRALGHALGEAYRGLLMVGRHPIVFMRLQMPAELVDVNVHPAKLEVRFQDSGRLYSQVLGAIRKRFLTVDLTSRIGGALAANDMAAGHDAAAAEQRRQEVTAWAQSGLAASRAELGAPSPGDSSSSDSSPAAQQDELQLQWDSSPRDAPLTLVRLDQPAGAPADGASQNTPSRDVAGDVPGEETTGAPSDSFGSAISAQSGSSQGGSASVGALQLHNRYLVAQDEEGMLVIDQHALHERILYEELRERVASGAIETQRLLTPEPVTLTAAEAAALLEISDCLRQLGIEIEPFGGDTILVSSYPAILANFRPAEALRQIVDHLTRSGRPPEQRDLLDELLNMIACKAAIKAGDKLSPEEIAVLLERRHLCRDSHHCPHGRPTALVFTREELDRRFKRT